MASPVSKGAVVRELTLVSMSASIVLCSFQYCLSSWFKLDLTYNSLVYILYLRFRLPFLFKPFSDLFFHGFTTHSFIHKHNIIIHSKILNWCTTVWNDIYVRPSPGHDFITIFDIIRNCEQIPTNTTVTILIEKFKVLTFDM